MAQSRYTYRKSSFFGYFPTGVKWLLIVNTAVFLLTSLFGTQFGDDIRLLALTPVALTAWIVSYQLWRRSKRAQSAPA